LTNNAEKFFQISFYSNGVWIKQFDFQNNSLWSKTEMRYQFFILMVLLFPALIKAQNGDKIISKLKSINDSLVSISCSSVDAAAISNRAMNIFLSDKTGYINAKSDVSFFTNYVTYNTTESRFTVYHNFQTATGADDPIKKLFGFGLSVNIPNNYASGFLDNRFDAGLGLLVGYKWLGKVKTRFTDCTETQNKANQKQAMDALRAGIVNSLTTEINKKEEDFRETLNSMNISDIQGLNTDSAKTIIQQEFYDELTETEEGKFATLQAEMLTKTMNFKLITSHWTAIQLYVPVVFSKYAVAPSYTAAFEEKTSYPIEITLNHTRLWESSKTGRWFATVGGGILLNNSKLSFGLDKTDFTEYKTMGGSDTAHDDELKNNKAYLGNYDNFITPSLQGRLVYFPVEYHLGISILVQQNFGSYNFLNARIGIPVILINAKKTPAVSFEFYVSLTDLTNKANQSNNPINKAMAGLSVGIPLSRLMY
jgi:hypothetical protein